MCLLVHMHRKYTHPLVVGVSIGGAACYEEISISVLFYAKCAHTF